MKLSGLVTKTLKDTSGADVSRNAQLLTRAGYINKLMAGVYSYLPLGYRVLNKIENIVREEMNGLGAQEILMPALQPREIWDTTGRWDKVDVLFKLQGAGDRDLALGPTHEEAVTPLISSYIQSYRDLPKKVYQIQTKFRNEPRAKSGLLRGREFRMKDMYSFHVNQQDLDEFYDRAIQGYKNVYQRCGLGDLTLLTYASGGVFSKYSHEFQTMTPYGEDIIYRVPNSDIAINKEIIGEREVLEELIPNYQAGDEEKLEQVKAIEVGNIFKLGSRFTDAFGAAYVDGNGEKGKVLMGCYGIGPSRVMGTVAEVLSDDAGLIWPKEISPFDIHLVSLVKDESSVQKVSEIYRQLKEMGFDVLLDDRANVQAGEKFSDADLIGVPVRAVIGKKSIEQNVIELRRRSSAEVQTVSLDQLRSFMAVSD